MSHRMDKVWEELMEEQESVSCVDYLQGSSTYYRLLFPAAAKDTVGTVLKVSSIDSP